MGKKPKDLKVFCVFYFAGVYLLLDSGTGTAYFISGDGSPPFNL